MSGAVLADAARVKPPGTANNNEASLVVATASPAVDLFAGQGEDLQQNWISLTCTNPFNFLVGEENVVADPTSLEFFAGGAVVQFKANRSKLGFMKIIIPLGGDYKFWVSGP